MKARLVLRFACCIGLLTFTSLAHLLFCQFVPRITVSGRVIDDSTGAPLVKANVFIANSTLGTSTDDDGRFSIGRVPAGAHELVASLLGYKQEWIRIKIPDSSGSKIEFRLRSTPIQLATVDILAAKPVEWKANLERFRQAFFGYSENAAQCSLLNPEVLDFVVDGCSGELIARARSALIIENLALGYRIKFHMREFNTKDDLVRYAGFARFEELPEASREILQTRYRARQRAYRGSLRHFLASLAQGRVEEEGFRMRSVPLVSDAFWRYAGRRTIRQEIIEGTSVPYEFKLSFGGVLQVLYTPEPPEQEYQSMIQRQLTGLLVTSGMQISLLVLTAPPAFINLVGHLRDPMAVTVLGYWWYERASEELPLDYDPKTDRVEPVR